MAMRVSFRQLNGEAIVLEIMPDITGRELKERIKDCQLWDDELMRKTTRVEIIVGPSRLLTNDETTADAGLSPESDVTVILKRNAVTCSHDGEFHQFADEFDLESLFVVEIPSGATEIVPQAFTRCETLASVTIPDSVTEIGFQAFACCSSLANVTIRDSVTEIGDGVFAGCSSVASVTIPDSVTEIGEEAFAECSSLASVTIPDSVAAIGQRAFVYCRSLTSVSIPDSVTHIGDGAFAGCSSLSSVTIPDSVTHIGDGAFAGCSSLATVTIPDSVTQIGFQAFAGCIALTLVVPITRIQFGVDVFLGCKRILAKECQCQECEYRWFLNGWVCPKQRWRSVTRHGRHGHLR